MMSSPSAGEVVSQAEGGLARDQGQMLGHWLGQMLTEVDCAHLQHLIQAPALAPPEGPRAPPRPAAVMVADAAGVSPFLTIQPIDLSASTNENCLVMPGERPAPGSGGAQGGSAAALARDCGQRSPANRRQTSPKQRRPSAGSCTEKRFDAASADRPGGASTHSAVLNHFPTMPPRPAEAQAAATHAQTQKWMKSDWAKTPEFTNPDVEGVCNPVIGRIPHVASRKCGTSHRPKAFITATPDSAAESGGHVRNSAQGCSLLRQQRERHNIKERERRKRIRMCCDELNLLVPFCASDTDKVTTLQWTIAFLRYINQTYGNTFKEDFQRTFSD